MNRELSASRASQGSYVQLNTFDEKEDDFEQNHIAFPVTSKHQRCICTRRDTILVAVVLLLAFILITSSLVLGLPKIQENRQFYLDTSFPVSSSPLLTFNSAVVVSDGKGCAPIGKKVLQDGGSAVDSAIATLFCESVVAPQSMGLGGGFLMTIYIKSNRSSYVIDARETAPSKATKDMFSGNKTLSQEGGLSIAVPGELRGYKMAHDMFGKLPFKNLVAPSIRLCRNGFTVTRHLADKLEMLRTRILEDDSMRAEFFNNQTNDLYKEGEVMKRVVYARTLEKITVEGPDILYKKGQFQSEFVEDLQNYCGSSISAEDLESYQPKFKPSIQMPFGGTSNMTLHTVPTPGSGLILSLILNVLSHFNMTAESFKDINQASLQYHRIIEAFKFAFAHRTQLGDESFVNISQVLSQLQSVSYAKSVFESISDEKTNPPSYYKPEMATSNDAGTSHVSVLAPNGDAVSVTSTINTYFGSLCKSPNTGIILNNAMDDFSSPNITNFFGLPPSPANYIAPGKRPLSSMCPAIIVDNNGDVKMVAGGAGGTRIITATAQGIIRTLWLSEDIKQATDALRLHHQLFPNMIQYEKGFPQIYLDKLKAFDHSESPESQDSLFFGIVREGDKLMTNVDFRKEGSADGF